MRLNTAAALVLAVSIPAVLAGCPKGASSTSSGEVAAAPAPTSGPKAETRRFRSALCAQPVLGWTADSEGAAVVYDELSFSEDGSFTASASVRFGGQADVFTCTEAGSWSLDDGRALSSSEAGLSIEINSTDCAGREAPISLHVRANIKDGETELAHR